MSIDQFHDLDLHTKLTIIYELLECCVLPSLNAEDWRGEEEE